MKPSIGRIVLYNVPKVYKDWCKNNELHELEQYPAIIINVSTDSAYTKNEVDLHIFHNITHLQGGLIVEDCEQGDEEGQWNWPEIKK